MEEDSKQPAVAPEPEKAADAPAKASQPAPAAAPESPTPTAAPVPPEQPGDADKGTTFSLKSGLIGLAIGLGATLLIALVVVTVGIYKFGWTGPAVDVATQALPYPAATVNGKTIRLAEFNDDIATLNRFYAKASEYGIDNFGAQPTEQEIRKNAMDRLIRNELLLEEAEKFGVTVSQDEIDSEFKTLIGEDDGSEISDQISDLYGWSEDQFKLKVIKPYLLESKLAEALADDESISGQAKTEAESVRKQIEDGADFSDMAAAYSDDVSNAQNGGQLGWFGRGVMVEEFEDAAFGLEEGEVSEPVQTQFGYHLIMIDDTKLDSDGEVEEVSASHILFRTPTVDDYLKERLEAAKIKKYVAVDEE